MTLDVDRDATPIQGNVRDEHGRVSTFVGGCNSCRSRRSCSSRRRGIPHPTPRSIARVDVSLNPALAEARFCPRCGRSAEVDFPRRIACPHCGYAAYYNPKPVAGAIPIDSHGRVILLRRGFDPGRGLWTFPGGFVDLGESVEEAALRETDEELGLTVELGSLVGVYSRFDERVVLIVYRASAIGRPRTTPEAVEVRAFARSEVPWHELAFWSTELALRDVFRQPALPSRAGAARG